jgi:hypothetical protein
LHTCRSLARPRAKILCPPGGKGPGTGGDHHLLHRLPDLFLAAVLSRGQLPNRSVHIRLAPELGRAVVEQVEVVGVVAFLLDDLELDVLVVQVGIVAGRIRLVGEMELAGEEEAGDLAGSEVAAQIEMGSGVLVLPGCPGLWLEASGTSYS